MMMSAKSEPKDSLLSEEQILELGQMSSEAYNNPIFAIVCQTMMAEAQREIDSAPPDHVKAVMWAKQKRQVIGEVCSKLISMRQHAERIYAEMQEKNSPAAQEQRHLDEQGYGLNFGQGGAQ